MCLNVCAVLRGAADLIRADYPEIFCEFSDHTQSFGYDTSLITELLNSWGYVGRNWGDGNAHFVVVPQSFVSFVGQSAGLDKVDKGLLPRQLELDAGRNDVYCTLVDCTL